VPRAKLIQFNSNTKQTKWWVRFTLNHYFVFTSWTAGTLYSLLCHYAVL